jgi:hypothetical protein
MQLILEIGGIDQQRNCLVENVDDTVVQRVRGVTVQPDLQRLQ